ncbi:DNA-directed RNA polymerase subunit alpha [Patescibacteria group bacterium]
MTEPVFQIKKVKETKDFGEFVIEPLKQGYGHTLGTSLRRVLLGDMPGTAVSQVRISGVKHQFSTLKGLKEDIVDFILNLKQLQVSHQGEKPVKLSLEATGPGKVKAAQIKVPAGVEVANKDLVLANLADKKSRLKAEIVVEKGFGYSPAESRKSDKLGVIPVDASFSPIRSVNYRVEETRVGRRTDLDRLILEISTNGTIKPSQALKEASKSLLAYFQQAVTPKKAPKVKKEKPLASSTVLELTVEELELPTRIANALRKGGYGTLGKLVAASQVDLSKVKNLGEKSIKIVEAALAQKGVRLKG